MKKSPIRNIFITIVILSFCAGVGTYYSLLQKIDAPILVKVGEMAFNEKYNSVPIDLSVENYDWTFNNIMVSSEGLLEGTLTTTPSISNKNIKRDLLFIQIKNILHDEFGDYTLQPLSELKYIESVLTTAEKSVFKINLDFDATEIENKEIEITYTWIQEYEENSELFYRISPSRYFSSYPNVTLDKQTNEMNGYFQFYEKNLKKEDLSSDSQYYKLLFEDK